MIKIPQTKLKKPRSFAIFCMTLTNWRYRSQGNAPGLAIAQTSGRPVLDQENDNISFIYKKPLFVYIGLWFGV